MTAQPPIKYYRIYFGIASVVGLSLLIGITAKFWTYFNTGADRATALNLPPNLPESHVPYIQWLPDDPQTGRKMEDFTRQEITKDYIRGWYQQHLSYMTGEPKGLKEYFTPSALPKVQEAIKQLNNKGFQLYQTELEHHIQLHFYSADGQIVSFTDRQVRLKKRLYHKNTHEKVYSSEVVADYEVVMLLDDGYWRVKNVVRKQTVPFWQDTLKVDKSKMVQIKGQQFYLANQSFFPKGINYYPQKTPWTFFWSKFDTEIISKDFALVQSLGFNTLRIFVNFHDFNKGNVSIEQMGKLRQLLDIAQKHHLKVIVTLFDFLGDYRLLNFPATDRQLETLLTTFREHPAILAWDLKNEPDLDFKYHDIADVQEWLQWILKRAKIYDPNHLLTIGWAYPENADFLGKELDFVSFHSYKSPEELAYGIEVLRKKMGEKPLILEEFGLSTYRGFWAPFGKNEEEQSTYFAQIREVLRKKGNIPYIAWTLYDFADVPTEVVGKMPWNRYPQKGFGVLNDVGKPKKGLEILVK